MSCSGEIVAENDLLQIKPAVTKKLKKAKYGIADHSTVELCHWTKKSFRGEGNCYKHKFYGISTHQCMEFSPAGMYCQNICVYCSLRCSANRKLIISTCSRACFLVLCLARSLDIMFCHCNV